MTEQALDQLARRVMLDAARLEYGSLPEEPHTFSPAFERKMKKLLRRGRHPVWYKALHAAACLLLALLLSGCAVLAVSQEAREVFAGWVREVYETSFIYRFSGVERTAAGDAFVTYRPAYIPPGFQMSDEFEESEVSSVTYRNAGDGLAVFNRLSDTMTPVFQIERDGTEAYQRVLVNGMPAELYLDRDEGENHVLLWTDEAKASIFRLSGPFDKAELLKMAESIEPVSLVYSLGWVPEGYEWFDSCGELPELIKYRREDGEMMLLSIMESVESMEMQVELNEGDTSRRVQVSGTEADLYLDATGGNSVLIWTDEESGLVFMLNGPLTEEELIQTAENIGKYAVRPAPHRPGWIPEGYARHGYSGGGASLELRYDREGGESIWFRYGESGELQEELQETLEGLAFETVQVDGQTARLYTDAESVRHLTWDGSKPGSDYWLSGSLSAEELIRIAESVGKQQE